MLECPWCTGWCWAQNAGCDLGLGPRHLCWGGVTQTNSRLNNNAHGGIWKVFLNAEEGARTITAGLSGQPAAQDGWECGPAQILKT